MNPKEYLAEAERFAGDISASDQILTVVALLQSLDQDDELPDDGDELEGVLESYTYDVDSAFWLVREMHERGAGVVMFYGLNTVAEWTMEELKNQTALNEAKSK